MQSVIIYKHEESLPKFGFKYEQAPPCAVPHMARKSILHH